jgi:hypothetical protein
MSRSGLRRHARSTEPLKGGLGVWRFCRALMIAVFALGVAAPSALSAPSSPVTISFTARVDFVDDFGGGALCADVAAGDKITGTYTYALNAPDSNPEPWVADYGYTEAPNGVTVNLPGGVTTRTNPDLTPGFPAPDFVIELINGYPFDGSDHYVWISYANDPLSCGDRVETISWQLDDPTGRALKDTALTKKPPKLKDFPSSFGLDIRGRTRVCMPPDPLDCREFPYTIRATVTSVK